MKTITSAIIETFGKEQLNQFYPLNKKVTGQILKKYAPNIYNGSRWGALQLITNKLNEELADLGAKC